MAIPPEVFVTGGLAKEERWPDFARRAHEETGVESILSVRLFARQDTMGSLNLYSSKPDAFDDHDVAVASVFAVHAAVAMSTARREDQLEAKSATRDLIGTAKGIIMARQSVGRPGTAHHSARETHREAVLKISRDDAEITELHRDRQPRRSPGGA